MRRLKVYKLIKNGKEIDNGSIFELAERNNLERKYLRGLIPLTLRNPDPVKREFSIFEIEPPKEKEKTKFYNTEEYMRTIVSDNIQRLREEQNVSIRYFAKELGIDYHYATQLEKAGKMSMKMLSKIVDFFQIDPIELFENWEDRERVYED